MVSVMISGSEEAIDELVQMLENDEMQSGEHVYTIKRLKIKK